MTKNSVRTRLNEIIFETRTPWGKTFDISILVCILLSLFTVMAESVPAWRSEYARLFIVLEYIFTTIFTIEYLLRIYASRRRLGYILSFYGIIDLLAILPVFLAMLMPGARSFLVLRTFRLIRIFRVFKINRYLNAGNMLAQALLASRAKIGVFLFTVLMVVTIVGTLMYLIEGEANGYTSIPKSIYWAIVTLTTVGYGDITPQTTLGQIFSSMLMISGYAIIAVPTGIISVELAKTQRELFSERICSHCNAREHNKRALFCHKCGGMLE